MLGPAREEHLVGPGEVAVPLDDIRLDPRSTGRASTRRPPRSFASLESVRRGIVACERCPRLRDYCERVAREKKREFRDWSYWGRPVPGLNAKPDGPLARFVIGGMI